ncbi:penicillin-binding transpeptidase domain-containing protein [Anaerosacchariphilus polymeriproducens]|uniref:Peptidoglycan glycosyltransferase n=1 Tax=Anaerosacchariphilus polymeriproducens TaxID=1812858 RepID=A0A371AU43_9FIRM|nr:penicillin-binding transpeptidase domain-containing protein [Anaerosacchariphilus polymeriproducens]RDU23062.1 peptidoglycan glycosyltransferase [Anaerosacchariphilus polymeriproducens]
MFNYIKEVILSIVKSRFFILAVTFVLLFVVLILRLFKLQIVNGEQYMKDFTMTIKKEKEIPSTRGNIYDRDGELLAYNELAYSVTIVDSGNYNKMAEKNEQLNKIIYDTIKMLEKNGETIVSDFNIIIDNNKLKYSVEGTKLKRFLADIFGYKSIDSLEYNKKLKVDEAKISAPRLFEHLCSKDMYGISDKYSKKDALKILNIRYNMYQNRFKKYVGTTIATQVKEETVALIKENKNELQGVDIEESTIRKYVDSEYFASIIGYTGKVSTEELEELNKEKKTYDMNDVIGKAGIESNMESELQGKKGSETLYVNNVGKVIETAETVDPISGNDVYLSINKNLQIAVYKMLEQKLAGILYNKIINASMDQVNSSNENKSASDLDISIDHVYNALINNNVIDISRFSLENASESEKSLYQSFLTHLDTSLNEINNQLISEAPPSYKDSGTQMQSYISYIESMLKTNEVLLKDSIDTADETYLIWQKEEISFKEYLQYAIAQNWIDISKLKVDSKYADSSEIYTALLAYIQETLREDTGFHKKVYKSLIQNHIVSGVDICMVLYDQCVLDSNDASKTQLASGELDPYTFMKEQIKTLKITPGQLALDPCSGSCVITNPNNGEILAAVSYPGYDNNRLANTVDSAYFSQLNKDLSLPLYNHATQETTAPGSTFKMVTAVAGLTEGKIDPYKEIKDLGKFEKIKPSPECWIYKKGHQTHGSINVSQAIEVSCNYFFYEVGYQLSSVNGTYNQDQGISMLQKYAAMFGLDQYSGIEIPETKPHMSDEYPVTSAIGQGNHTYTTSQLARYVTTVANSGTCYDISLIDKVKDNKGKLVKDYTPKIHSQLDDVSESTWNAVHEGMKLVVNKEHKDIFSDINNTITLAGKTGTAQQITTRANHALFVGYSSQNTPGASPDIAFATRIAFGYSSSNAADFMSDVIRYYYKIADENTLINGEAKTNNTNLGGD